MAMSLHQTDGVLVAASKTEIRTFSVSDSASTPPRGIRNFPLLEQNGGVIHNATPISESVVGLASSVRVLGHPRKPSVGQILIFDFASGCVLSKLATRFVMYDSIFLRDVSLMLCSSTCRAGAKRGEVCLWNTEKEDVEPTRFCTQDDDTTFRVQYREDVWPNRFLAGSFNSVCTIWDLVRETSIAFLRRHTFWVRGVDVSCTGDLVATGANFIRLWDTKTFEETHVDRGEVCRMMFPRDHSHLVVAGGYCSVRCLDLRKPGTRLFNSMIKTSQYHYGITEIDRNRFATSTTHGEIFVWDYAGNQLNSQSVQPSGAVSAGICWVPSDESENLQELEERIHFLIRMIDSLGTFALKISISGFQEIMFLRGFHHD